MPLPTLYDYLRKSLLFWICIPGLCLVIVVGVGTGLNRYSEIEERNKAIALALSKFVADYVTDSVRALEYFSFRLKRLNRAEQQLALKALFETYPNFERLVFLNADGMIVSAFPPGFEGLEFPMDIPEQGGVRVLSRPIVSPGTESPVIYLGTMVDGGGVLVGELSLSALTRHLHGLLPDSDEIVLTDKNANIVVHPDMTLVLQQENLGEIELLRSVVRGQVLTGQYKGRDGQYRLGTVVAADVVDWKVFISTPLYEVFRPVAKVTSLLLVILSFSLGFFVFVFTRQLRKKIDAPFHRFMEIMKSVGEGRFSFAMQMETPFAEMETMSGEFKKMALDVASREEQLMENAERHRALFFDNKLVQMVVDSENGQILQTNRMARTFYGYAQRVLESKRIFDLIHGNAGRVQNEFESVFKRRSVTVTTQNILSTGDIRDVEIHVSPAEYHESKYLFLTILDISERVREESRLAQVYRTFLEFGPESLENIEKVVRLVGRITEADHAFYAVFDDESFTVRAQWNSVGKIEFGALGRKDVCFGGMLEDQSSPLVMHGLCSGYDVGGCLLGDEAEKTCFVQPLRSSDGMTGALCAIYRREHTPSDFDKRLMGVLSTSVRIEEERLASSVALKMARDKAEQANRSKSEFLANISHELRTPLNGMFGMLQLMEDTALDAEQKEYVDIARRSGSGLLAIINDILDFSRMEAGAMQLRDSHFRPAEILDLVTSNFQSLGEERRTKLTVAVAEHTPIIVKADEGRVRQLLFNIVGNAMKFADGGTVSVTVFPLVRGGRQTLIAFLVEDDGVGIPGGKLSEIFQPFSQVDGSFTRKFQGTGLGLSIARKLVALMGGTLCIDSELGSGTSVLFTVPVQILRAVDDVSRSETVSHVLPEGLRVLIAEDERINYISISRFLQKHDVHTTWAKNGKEAVEMLEDEHFDCVLMDIQMPEMDGVEATETIREGTIAHGGSDVPIIALTAHALAKDKDRFLKAGMDAYLSKPVAFPELVRTILEVLEEKRKS